MRGSVVAKALLNRQEQVLYGRLVRAFPGHIILSRVELSRLLVADGPAVMGDTKSPQPAAAAGEAPAVTGSHGHREPAASHVGASHAAGGHAAAAAHAAAGHVAASEAPAITGRPRHQEQAATRAAVSTARAITGRVRQLIADFVICRSDFSALAVLEVDEIDTPREATRERNRRKDHSLQSAGIKVIRLAANDLPDEAALKALVAAHPLHASTEQLVRRAS